MGAVGLVGLWNLIMTVLALYNIRLANHRLINVAVDLVATLMLFFFTGGFKGPLMWVGLLPLVSAGMYYEIRGGVITGALMVVSQIILGWVVSGSLDWKSIGLATIWNLGMGLVFGALGSRIIILFRSAYHAQLDRRREAELRAQREENKRLRTFYRMIETLSATLNYRVVLDTILDLSVTLLGENEAEQMISAVLLQNASLEMHVNAAWGLSPVDARLHFPGKRGVLELALSTDDYQLLTNPSDDPELGKISNLKNCRMLLCLPLQRGMESFGVLIYAHPQGNFFTQDRIELLEMVSHQAVIAIQNARLYEDLAQEKKRLMEVEDEARKRLARQLHDGPVQSIAGIVMRLAIARRILEKRPASAAVEMLEIEELARHTVEEIRHMLFTLRPLVLESEGLIAALQVMVEKMQETFQQPVKVDVDPTVVEQMDPSKQTVVFYLIEEASTNARKHAEASEIRIHLNWLEDHQGYALLVVEDDGRGFDVNEVMGSYERRGSLGLISLQERTDLIGGIFNITSQPGSGTCVKVIIPLNFHAEEQLRRGLITFGE